jgi:hypothetical protein
MALVHSRLTGINHGRGIEGRLERDPIDRGLNDFDRDAVVTLKDLDTALATIRDEDRSPRPAMIRIGTAGESVWICHVSITPEPDKDQPRKFFWHC